MPEIDQFNANSTQNEQLEKLDSINESMQKLVSLEEKQNYIGQSTNQFFQSNAVDSTVASLPSVGQLSQIGYARFETDLSKLTNSVNQIAMKVGAPVGSAVGGATSYALTQPFVSETMRPFNRRVESFWGVDPAYETTYRSSFGSDLAGSIGLIRAPQNMYQQDFVAEAQQNIWTRVRGGVASPLNLLGIDAARDESLASDMENYSRRFIKYGNSTAISGTGFSRQQSLKAASGVYNMALNDLGINYEQARAVNGISAETGQYTGVNSMPEMLSRLSDILRETQNVAKATGMTIQEAAQTMGQLRQSMGITSVNGQSSFLMNTAALGMSSGLTTSELLGGALIGANAARGTGFNIAQGGILGRNNLAYTNNMFSAGVLSEDLVQQAGGVENLSARLTANTIGFAAGQGQMYLMAGLQNGQFNQGRFNQAISGGFGDLGAMAGGNVNSIQGYANFMANRQDIMKQAGTSNTIAMQRANLEQMFKQVSGREYNLGSTDDTNMMKMLATNTMFGGDSITAQAFVTTNFTEDGLRSVSETRREAFAAKRMAEKKRTADLDYQQNSFSGYATRLENRFINQPISDITGAVSDFVHGSSTDNELDRQAAMRATGQMSYGPITSEDYGRFIDRGEYKTGQASKVVSMLDDNDHYLAKIAGGASVGMSLGAKAGLAVGAIGGAFEGMLTGAAAGAFGGPLGSIIGAGVGAIWGGMWGGTVGGLVGGAIAGTAAGAAYGLFDAMSSSNEKKTLGGNALEEYNKVSNVWNTGKNFNSSESATMQDPGFKKKMFGAMKNAGVLGQFKVDNKNSVQIAAAVKQISNATGYSQEMVSGFMQNEGMVSGELLEGADLAFSKAFQTGSINEPKETAHAISTFLNQNTWLGDNTGKGMENLVNSTDALAAFSEILDSAGTGDLEQRTKSTKKFLDLTKGMGLSEGVGDTISEFARTGSMGGKGNIMALKGQVDHLRQTMTSDKFNKDVSDKFSGMAEDYKGDSETYKALTELGSSPKGFGEKVSMLYKDLGNETFRNAVRADPMLKKVVSTFEANVSGADLKDSKAFAAKFGMSVNRDQLEQFKNIFAEEGESGVKKRLIAGDLAKGGSITTGKPSEEKLLNDTSHNLLEVTRIVEKMKNKS